MQKETNKRRSPRLDCWVPIEGKTGGPFDVSRTVDFSRGGFGVISQREIPLNQKIAIEIDMSETGDPVFVSGTVRWVRPLENSSAYRVGIAFEGIENKTKSRLTRYFRGSSRSKISGARATPACV